MPKKKTSKTPRKVANNCCPQCDPNVHPLHKVTSLSKILAAVLFITIPFVAFMLGTQYQMMLYAGVCNAVSAIGY